MSLSGCKESEQKPTALADLSIQLVVAVVDTRQSCFYPLPPAGELFKLELSGQLEPSKLTGAAN